MLKAVLATLLAAATFLGEAHAVPVPGTSTQTSVTVAGLTCNTLYRVRINPVGQANQQTTLRIQTLPCVTTPPPGGEPGPIAGQGYSKVFEDNFDTLNRGTWCERQWWEDPPQLGSQTVANGELRLRRTRAQGYANTTISTEPCGQANPRSFQYGYMEARMRYEPVRGNGPAFWMLSTRHATNPVWPNIHPDCAGSIPDATCLTSEIDVVEGFGNVQYGGTRTDDFYNGALHRNTSGFYGAGDDFTFIQHGTNLEFENYHTFAALWTPDTVSYYIDGNLQGTLTAYDSTDQPMHLLLSNWNTPWEDENMPDGATENELDTFVDWVRVWQLPNPPDEPQWTQPNIDIVVDEPDEQGWTCMGFQDRALVRVRITTTAPDATEAINHRNDCHGHIGRYEITAFKGHDLLDFNAATVAPHDLTVDGGFVRARGASPNAHQDCIQFTNNTFARNILLSNIVFSGCDTQYIISSSSNVRNIICNSCTFLPEHSGLMPPHLSPNGGPANAFILEDGGAGTVNTIVCRGPRFDHGVRLGVPVNPLAIGWVDSVPGGANAQPAPGSGNLVLPASDIRCQAPG